MLPCANLLLVLPFVVVFVIGWSCEVWAAAIENDTTVVGSLVHETKVRPPVDLSSAGSKRYKTHESAAFDDGYGGYDGDSFGKLNSGHGHGKDLGKDAYNKFNTYHSSDGDGYGYSQSFAYKDNGKKGDKDGDGDDAEFDELGSFDDEDEAADSMSPKYTEWHFDQGGGGGGGGASSKPSSYYGLQSDGDGDQSKSKLVGPNYYSSSNNNNNVGYDSGGPSMYRREKRKKDNVSPSAATEYDNYEYAEEPEEATADFEAEEAPDPEYGPVYADQADAYDYY